MGYGFFRNLFFSLRHYGWSLRKNFNGLKKIALFWGAILKWAIKFTVVEYLTKPNEFQKIISNLFYLLSLLRVYTAK